MNIVIVILMVWAVHTQALSETQAHVWQKQSKMDKNIKKPES